MNKSDQHLISPYNIPPPPLTHHGQENKGNDPELKKILIAKKILLVSTSGDK